MTESPRKGGGRAAFPVPTNAATPPAVASEPNNPQSVPRNANIKVDEGVSRGDRGANRLGGAHALECNLGLIIGTSVSLPRRAAAGGNWGVPVWAICRAPRHAHRSLHLGQYQDLPFEATPTGWPS